MTTSDAPRDTRSLTPVSALLLGGLTVGVLDGLYAVVVWALRGVSPLRVFQGVAAGLLGRPSFEGGVPTFLLGLGLHFFIATVVVTVYLLASRRLAFLTRHPVVCGLAYGVAVHLVMGFVVIPLSAITRGPFQPLMFWSGLAAHAVFVGLPAAFVARAAR
jgi:hypothetical protein